LARDVDPRELQESFDRLADLLLFRERFGEDPQATLERYEVRGVPESAVEALADLSPEELELFARVHRKLDGIQDEISGEFGTRSVGITRSSIAVASEATIASGVSPLMPQKLDCPRRKSCPSTASRRSLSVLSSATVSART
jgi:hypothetical protein